MPAHHLKNIAGKRAAAEIAKNAAIGTGIGVVFAMIYKVKVMDAQKNAINNYYANLPRED